MEQNDIEVRLSMEMYDAWECAYKDELERLYPTGDTRRLIPCDKATSDGGKINFVFNDIIFTRCKYGEAKCPNTLKKCGSR